MSAATSVTEESAGTSARAVVVGAAVGSIGLFLMFGGMVLAAGMGLSAAIGVGLFTAFWGGLGFGGMVGMVHAHNREEAR